MADNTTTSGTDTAVASSSFDFRLYRYTPSLSAAIILVVVFAFLSGLHTCRLQRHRAFYFTAFTVGGFCTQRPRNVTLPQFDTKLTRDCSRVGWVLQSDLVTF